MPPGQVQQRTPRFAEKDFYLDEFRNQTVLLTVALDNEPKDTLSALAPVVSDLVRNGTRVIWLVGNSGKPPAAAVRRALREATPATAGDAIALTVSELDPANRGEAPIAIWQKLRRKPLFVGFVRPADLIESGGWLAGTLRIQKWVILQSEGGVHARNGSPISFMDDSMLTEISRTGAAEWTGIEGRSETLAGIQDALRNGVGAVNLCSPADAATELFTYEGAGTLFTLEDYCRVEPLGIDDFEEVEQLLERGYQEGFLKPRQQSEIGDILLNGYGAKIGNRHLAGVCGLLTAPYRRSRAGEIAGLYTVTRFKTEGVGGHLIHHLVAEARRMKLRYLFACTTDRHAAAFFQRHGFARVSRSRIPAPKWRGYSSKRARAVTVLRRDLA